jgi:hypothetical protein
MPTTLSWNWLASGWACAQSQPWPRSQARLWTEKRTSGSPQGSSGAGSSARTAAASQRAMTVSERPAKRQGGGP